MSRNFLEINHMKKSFGELEVIKDISLTVKEGEVVSIIGPSGSGKSTLLRCATMLEKMDGGELSFLEEKAAHEENGRCVYASRADLKRIHKHFGLVFQSFNLFNNMNVLDNCMIGQTKVLKKSKEEARKNAMYYLEKVGMAPYINARPRQLSGAQLGLSDKKDAYPYQLSGGQQQRVSIARALALQPKILFFDEPTSALDPELTGEVLKVIRQLAQEHMTMIIVTHEMQFARELSDRIIFMEQGVICQEGTPEELFSSPNARVREFIGRVMNV